MEYYYDLEVMADLMDYLMADLEADHQEDRQDQD
jgi:hypothetical protein